MVNSKRLCSFVLILTFVGAGLAPGAIVEVGTLNIINDPGNPSDGLGYLDMSFSDGLTLAAALANAQATHPGARVATPQEWDDLFDGAGISVNPAFPPSAAFLVGARELTSNDPGLSALIAALGPTGGNNLIIWSDPDAFFDPLTTREDIEITATAANIDQSNDSPPHSDRGWLLVSDVVATAVDIDIKPQACPNPVNTKSKGVLLVAVLGSQDFDVFTIDPVSVRLEGVAPVGLSYDDVAAPLGEKVDDCDCTEEGPDGFLDLTLKFKTQEIVAALGEVNDGDEIVLNMTGQLNYDVQIEGSDCVLIISKGKP